MKRSVHLSAFFYTFSVLACWTNIMLGSEPELNAKQIAQQDFASFNFGTGLSLTLDLGKNDRVKRASIVNGVVRVDEDNNNVPRFLLETHYFFTPNKSLLGKPQGDWGIGPFVCIEPGDKIINAIGGGLMIGLRRPTENLNSKTIVAGFSLGIGILVEPSVQILGDGIVENRPLPEGETTIRYKNTSQAALALVFTITF